MFPQFNPEFTFGSIMIIVSTLVTWGITYGQFRLRMQQTEKEIKETSDTLSKRTSELRDEFSAAILTVAASNKEIVLELKGTFKDMQKDIKLHIMANSEQHLNLMKAAADLSTAIAVMDKDLDGIKRLQDEMSRRIEAISNNTRSYIAANSDIRT